MRLSHFVLAASVLVLAQPIATTSSLAAECSMAGTLSPFGANSAGGFAIPAGRSCLLVLRLPGSITQSSVTQKPAHGTLRRLNVSSYQYSASKGYKGSDTFAVTATGTTQFGAAGTSVVTLTATVQ